MWSRTDNRQRLEEETPTPEPSIKDHPRPATPPPSDGGGSTLGRPCQYVVLTFFLTNLNSKKLNMVAQKLVNSLKRCTK